MKLFKYILPLIVLGMVACTPKTTDKMVDKTTDAMEDKMKDEMEHKMEDKVMTFRSKAPESGPAKPVQMGDYTIEELDNGLKIIIVENHKLPLVNFQLSLNSPPILEVIGGKNKTGYVGIAGSLMSAGTTKRTKAEIDQRVDYLGASLSTSGRSASGQCLNKHIDEYLDIFSDVLLNPAFPEEEFNKEIKRTISGLQSAQDDPNAIAGRVRSSVLFGKDHPYGLSASNESVNSITLDDVKTYYKNTFYPANSYLIIVGDITPSDAKDKAMQYFGKWQNPEAMISYAPMPTPKKLDGASVDFVNKVGAVQSVVNIAYPVDIKPGDDDAIKASLMNAILGGGVFSSRLMKNLREDKAYTYGARSSLSIDPYQGSFNAFASVRNEVTDSSVVEFLYEMNKLRTELVAEEDLDISKKFMIGTFARSISNPSTVARLALNTAKYNLPKEYYQNYIANITKVTQDDILEMAKKYVTPDNAHIVVVGNKSDIAEKLIQFDADKTIDFYDVQGNYVEPADEKIPEGHTAEIVIGDYLDALGGKDKIDGIKDMESVYETQLMGRGAMFVSKMKSPSMMSSEVKVGEMTMQKKVFNGSVLKVSGMQGGGELTEGAEFLAAKEQTVAVLQTLYGTSDYSIKLDGIEKIDGKPHYIVLVKKPGDKSVTEYYDVETNLLRRSTEVLEAQGQTISLTNEFTDYEAVNGVMFPSTISISGMMPEVVVLKKVDLKVNSGLSDDDFK